MKIVKRRVSCAECRGLCGNTSFNGQYCSYGFATGYRDVPTCLTRSGKIGVLFPLEPCPRPRNYDEGVDADIYLREHKEERWAARERLYEQERRREHAEQMARIAAIEAQRKSTP